MERKVGVLALQGDFEAHYKILKRAGVEPEIVKTPESIRALDGLIIPGGESTTFLKLARIYGVLEAIKSLAREGKPIFGTCAGLILLSKRTFNPEQDTLGLIDLVVCRNGYGSQKDSFEASIHIPVLGEAPFPLVFIRAPMITEIGAGVEPLASYDGKVILARQKNIVVATFHPELTDDVRVHEYFLGMLAPHPAPFR